MCTPVVPPLDAPALYHRIWCLDLPALNLQASHCSPSTRTQRIQSAWKKLTRNTLVAVRGEASNTSRPFGVEGALQARGLAELER